MYTAAPIADILRDLDAKFTETSAFPNLKLIQTPDPLVYFDARANLNASPIQTWLEMANGDKRSKEAGQPLRAVLIEGEG